MDSPNPLRLHLEGLRAERAKRAREAQMQAVTLRGEEIKQRSATFIGFIREAWHVLEPDQTYREGWALRLMAEHMEAIHFGWINRLCMNVPPGLMKSLMVSVFFPAWEWGPMAKPSLRSIATSHSAPLSERDALKFRNLIDSDWYQSLWGDRVVRARPWTADNAHNKATGFRKASVFSAMTGERGNRVTVDDPLSVSAADSAAERKRVLRLYRETLPTRLNDRSRDAIILIMQRLHEDDPSGYIEKHLSTVYTRLVLPMRYDPSRSYRGIINGRELFDPRTVAGELLMPERFDEADVAQLEKELGPYAAAGQLQQLPGPREGSLFKAEWLLKRVRALPAGCKFARAWDFAATAQEQGGDPDATATIKAALAPDGTTILVSGSRHYLEGAAVEELVVDQTRADGPSVRVRLPQDPAQAGKAQAKRFVTLLRGFSVVAIPPTGDKERRATPLASQARVGNVAFLETGDPIKDAWIDDVIDELIAFPGGSHDDYVDAAADAFLELSGIAPGQGVLDWMRSQEEARQAAISQASASLSVAGGAAMRPPRPVAAHYVLDGTCYRPDDSGSFIVAPAHQAEMLAAGFVFAGDLR